MAKQRITEATMGVKMGALDPDVPILDAIDNDLLAMKIDKWLKKSYTLDFGMAHCEIPSVLEDINVGLQRANIAVFRAKKDAEELEGMKYMKLRQEWSATYQDKMTEATLAAVMAQDQECYEAWNRYAVLKSHVVRLENLLENMRLKLGAMRSFEATRRKLNTDDRD